MQRQKYIRFLPRNIRQLLESFIGNTGSKLMKSFRSGCVVVRKEIVC
ncbi:hypothetical protein [Francisella noatunensis]|nr:hypothetical protein [Francisella noatunensis]